MVKNILWETNVGSHMWGMEHEKSDIDIFQVYAENTLDILKGVAKSKSYHNQEGIMDYAVHEIGHVINHRLKGNVNFMWGIHSPITIKCPRGFLLTLQKISNENLSKNTYHSIRGLALKNMKKYILTKETPPPIRAKNARIILRTINFGIGLLMGKIRFYPVTANVSPDEIELAIDVLERAYEESNLPETPDEEPFRDYLVWIRRYHDLSPTVETPR